MWGEAACGVVQDGLSVEVTLESGLRHEMKSIRGRALQVEGTATAKAPRWEPAWCVLVSDWGWWAQYCEPGEAGVERNKVREKIRV